MTERYRVVRGSKPPLFASHVQQRKTGSWTEIGHWSTREDDAVLWGNRSDADAFARECSSSDRFPYVVEVVEGAEDIYAISHDPAAEDKLVRHVGSSKKGRRHSYRAV